MSFFRQAMPAANVFAAILSLGKAAHRKSRIDLTYTHFGTVRHPPKLPTSQSSRVHGGLANCCPTLALRRAGRNDAIGLGSEWPSLLNTNGLCLWDDPRLNAGARQECPRLLSSRTPYPVG